MNDVLIRELMNGMWFVLSVEIWLALIIYIVRRIIREPAPALWIKPSSWYADPATQLAVAWTTYMTGSGIRAGWIWMLLECQGRLGIGNCGHITKTVEILFAASLFAIVGGVCTIRIMLPEDWRPWSYVVPAALAIIVPVAVHAM